jgi:predicted HicB family RNase H-like nuclease
MAFRMKQQELNAQLVVRVPPVLREQLERAAAERDRPLAYLVRQVLRDWAEQHWKAAA